MSSLLEDRRLCPTREDGADPLIAHLIPRATCQERQRRHYHKCFTCVYRNGAEGKGKAMAAEATIARRLPALEVAPVPEPAPVVAEERVPQVIYISATPRPYELTKSKGIVVEQIIRPTGLTDPNIEVRPVRGQVDDLLVEIRKRVEAGERVLITTLTKRFAEDLAEYYQELGVRVRYLHSDIDTLERVAIIRELRKGEFDVLVGINLLREGLDLPEVSLVAILDADKEGFLRSETSLIQTAGRAARNIHGTVLMYADQMTRSIQGALRETHRRQQIQQAYNKAHGIIPRSVERGIREIMVQASDRDYITVSTIRPTTR